MLVTGRCPSWIQSGNHGGELWGAGRIFQWSARHGGRALEQLLGRLTLLGNCRGGAQRDRQQNHNNDLP